MAGDALLPPPVDTAPDERYRPQVRPFQGIPGIEAVGPRRLFATWYSCGAADLDHFGEGPTNYVILARSDDEGRTWLDPALVVDPPGDVRAFDPCLWQDPLGRLWLFWAQSHGFWDGRAGVWAIRCDRPEEDAPAWSTPERLCNGIMMNKPTVLADGTWLLPAAVWDRPATGPGAKDPHPEVAPERRPNVVASTDQGATWAIRGGVDIADRAPDEHMVVQMRDGRLWMLIRTRYGIGQSFSSDGGATWSPGEPAQLSGPNSRFYIRRLRSGRLLLVNHRVDAARPRLRSNLCAWLSEDEGKTWRGGQLIDEREKVSYPDGAERGDGRLAIVYDWDRHGHGHILMAEVSESDILSGITQIRPALNRHLISAAGGCRPAP
jgi:hypothetical protein